MLFVSKKIQTILRCHRARVYLLCWPAVMPQRHKCTNCVGQLWCHRDTSVLIVLASCDATETWVYSLCWLVWCHRDTSVLIVLACVMPHRHECTHCASQLWCHRDTSVPIVLCQLWCHRDTSVLIVLASCDATETWVYSLCWPTEWVHLCSVESQNYLNPLHLFGDEH